MKKPTPVLIGSVVIVVAVVAVIGLVLSSKKASSPTSNSTTYTIREACDILTSTIAQQVAGSNVKKYSIPDTKASGINLSYCSYSGSKGLASLTIRSPLNQTAVSANENQFGDKIPVGVQTITGYGTAAYWDPQYSQFDILDHDTWYILAAGSSNPTDRTIAQAKQLAKLIINKF